MFVIAKLISKDNFLDNIKKINGWRKANKTKAVIICAPVLDGNGRIENWGNDEGFRIEMARSTIPFLLNNTIEYIRRD